MTYNNFVDNRKGAPTITKRNNATEDSRLTTCTDCRFGIFKHQDKVWTRRGFVHTGCEAKRLADEAKDDERALSERRQTHVETKESI